ncbi:MAG: hypothetical protein K9M11_02270 [Candidatus Pacebacteria bacterium]|nr:hypothetical protein [Candidatus Paceibacterota bacterium]
MANIEKKIELIGKSLAIYATSAYGLGFFVWNIYLQFLGVTPNLFQGIYILTGTCFILTYIGLYGFAKLIIEIINGLLKFFHITISPIFAEKGEISNFIRFLCTIVVSIFFVYVFSIYLFPANHSYFGGARPKLVSIIANEDQINFLQQFGIKKVSGIQTAIVCTAYEDNENIVVVLEDRILSLKKDEFKGFARLPYDGEYKDIEKCKDTILTNIMGWRKLIIENPNK